MVRVPLGTTGFSPSPVAWITPVMRVWSAMRGQRKNLLRPRTCVPQRREVEMRSPLRWSRAALAWSAGILLCCASLVGAQGTGTVRGTVTDAVTRRPVDGVQVYVAGTDLGTLTNSLGQYQLNVPAGTLELRVRRGGRGRQAKHGAAAAAGGATAELQMVAPAGGARAGGGTRTGARHRR